MRGFFEREEIKEKEFSIRKKRINNSIKKEKNPCEKCGLKNKSEKSFYNEKSDILVIINYYNQDISYIQEKLQNVNYSLTFALQCQTDEDITTNQINCCRNNLKKVIEEIKPKKILTFGLFALQSLIGDKQSITDINKWVGWCIPDQDFKCWIFPNFYIQNDENIILNRKFEEYLFQALNWNRKFKEIKPEIQIMNEEQAYFALYNLQALKEEIIAIDYETSGLKSHANGHFIYSIAITQFNMFTFSFILNDKTREVLKQILQNKNIKKIIQNCQFEIKWSDIILNTEIENVVFDTQLASHILDNRSGITGLKFQSYVNFGVNDYSDKIKKYLESENSNEINKIKEAGINDVLYYNGEDTFYTMLLYKKQYNSLNEHLWKGFNLFLEGNIELSRLSGIRFDKKVYKENYDEMTRRIEILHKEIINSDEIKLLKNNSFYIGKSLIDDKNFNYDSNQQLLILLFDICKYKSSKRNVEEETLRKLNKKFTNNILEIRKLYKIRDTYLQQFERESVYYKNDYYIFPFFSLNNVTTMRSSAQAINFQNIPVRNELAKKMTRSCIIPRNGHKLLEIDFKTLEVCIGCAYHKDSKMIDYVVNKGDMHSDVGNQLFFRNNDFIEKERFFSKNGFVFPSFYGSTSRMYSEIHKRRGYGDITLNLWEMIHEKTKEHLKENGINNIFDFQRHVENIEKDFWDNRFPEYKQWKFDNWKLYKERGYIDLYTGFRLTAIMGFNDCNNYAIQGSAFHVALKTLIELNKFLRNEKFNSVIIGEIHDSVIIDIDPLEFDFIIRKVNKILENIRIEWDWINVPLTVEYATTGINESWYNKKDIKI